MNPLVTCIMPTANRRGFVRRAVELFLAQDYPNKRLLIVEDGAEHCEDSVLEVSNCSKRIDYAHLGVEQRSIGVKRNIACELADTKASKEGLIMHWDDDDWHSPRRISAQVTALQNASARLCGASQLVFFDVDGSCVAPQRGASCAVRGVAGAAYIYRSQPNAARALWLAGGTLLYERSLWVELGFTDRSNGEDTCFVDAAMRRGTRVAVLDDPSLYVAMIHTTSEQGVGNTAHKRRDMQWGGFDAALVQKWMRNE